MNPKQEESFKNFKSFIRKLQYSIAFIAAFMHSCASNILFTSKVSDVNVLAINSLTSLFGIVIAFVFCAAIIETGLLLIEKNLKGSSNEEE